jgi:plasmid replication initiation protein
MAESRMKTVTDTKKTGLVVKGNRLVEASYRLSLMEQRLILFAIVAARETQQGLGDEFVTIDALKFARMFGIDETGIYDKLKAALLSLYRREVSFRDTDPQSGKERVVLTRWIWTGSYISDGGAVQLKFSDDVIPFLTRLEKEFTAYRLERIGKLTSAHAVRLYEMLVQYLSIGSPRRGPWVA